MMALSFLPLTKALGEICDKTFSRVGQEAHRTVIHKEDNGREPTTVPAHSQKPIWTLGQGGMVGRSPRREPKLWRPGYLGEESGKEKVDGN